MKNNQDNQLNNMVSLTLISFLVIILLPFIFVVFLIDYTQQKRNNCQGNKSSHNIEEINIYSYWQNIQPIQESN